MIYTYSSFVNSWGAGPELKKLFQKNTGHDLEFVDVGEAGVILQRVRLEGDSPKADVVLGLDQVQILDSDTQSLFEMLPRLNVNIDQSIEISFVQKEHFVAFNWAPMSFIYRTTEIQNPPQTLEDLVSQGFNSKIVLMDPRTSAPGFIFLNWIVQRMGKEPAIEFLKALKKKVFTVSPSWSSAYGLFKKKQADLVFSYLTSPVYHWIEEKDEIYQPVYLKEKHPVHIEYAGILNTSTQKEKAQAFLDFLLDPDAQKIIMQKNYMLPVTAGVTKGSEFEKLKKVDVFEEKPSLSREEVLNVWKSVKW